MSKKLLWKGFVLATMAGPPALKGKLIHLIILPKRGEKHCTSKVTKDTPDLG